MKETKYTTGAVIVQYPRLTIKNIFKNIFWPYHRDHDYEIKFSGAQKAFFQDLFEQFWDENKESYEQYSCSCQIMEEFLRIEGFEIKTETERRQHWVLI